MSSIRASALTRAAAIALSAGLAAQSSALTINLTFNAGSTDQFIDPFGVNRTNELHAVMNAAASIWEDIIETTHTLNISYWWDDLDPGTLGVHNLVSQAGGRETAGNIRFDTLVSAGNARRWFFDPTPFDDSEFDMQQTLWRDASATQQADWFNGTAHDTFEIGYGGAAFAGAPADARLGVDLLSVALHEIGHALGMSSANTATIAETGDNDYDFNTAFTGGMTLAAEVADGSNIAHLDGNPTLMFPSVGSGFRNGVGATDALASASGANWGVLDLPRKEWVSNSANWTTTLAWIGGATPGSADDVYVRSGRTAILTASGFADNVFVSEAGNININAGGLLNVFGDATVSGLDSDFVVAAGGELQVAGQLIVTDTAQVFMSGGLVDMNGGGRIDAGAEIFGNGTVDVAGGDLVNEGRIFASGGLLTVQGVDGTLDLDGFSAAGELWATSGDLTVIGAMNDTHDGMLVIGATRTMTLSSPWQLGLSGTLDMNGNSTDAATLSGGLATLGGSVDVSGIGIITSLAAFTAGADVTVASGGRLELDGSTTMTGGSYTGAGEIQADGILTIAGSTTIDVDTFDWDGFSGATQTFVNNGSLFTINSSFVDDGNNAYNGSLTLNGGSDVTVNTDASWGMNGTLVMNGGSVIAGETMTVAGSIDSNGSNSITANVSFGSGATVLLAGAGDILNLNGATTYNGGTYTGLGRLVQNGAATVANDTTIAVAVYDWDGGGLAITSINNNADLVLNVGTVDVGNDIFDGTVVIGNGGSLTVNNTANEWTNSGTVNLQGGSLLGETVDNVDLITGFGTIGARVINNGTIAANGGTLIINSAVQPDIDGNGAPEAGVLSALAGNLRVVNALGSYQFDGTMNVGAGRTMTFDSAIIFNGGVLNMTGGTLVLDGLNQNAEMNVTSSTATVQASTINFGAGSDTTINSTLFVNGATTIAATAGMTGAGRLVNNGTLSGNFAIAVDLENRGQLNPGASPGVMNVDGDFVNRSNGTMNFEINGLNANQYDRINITGDAGLDGTLNVMLGGGFTPDWGDRWSIINYTSVTEVLDVVSFTALGDPLLLWWYEATADSFDVGVRHIADVNHDDSVNFADLNLVVSFFNMFGDGLPGDANEDGAVDFTDLNLVVSFFNTSAPANVPAPGGAALMAISLGLGLSRRRR